MSSIESKGQEIPEEIIDWIDAWKRKNIVSSPEDWEIHGVKCVFAASIALDLYRHLRAHSSQADENKVHPVYKGWNSLKLIGRVKDRFQELIRKGWDWTGFYHGWLEGRAEMLDEMKKDWDESPLQPIKEPVIETDKKNELGKCGQCKNLKIESLGKDEVGAPGSRVYCSKEHWEGLGNPEDIPPVDDPWEDCEDFDSIFIQQEAISDQPSNEAGESIDWKGDDASYGDAWRKKAEALQSELSAFRKELLTEKAKLADIKEWINSHI